MLEKFIAEGNKIELKSLRGGMSQKEEEQKDERIYNSLVAEIMDDRRIKITMPFEKGKMLLLPVGTRYSACFYTSNRLYTADVLISEIYKNDNVVLLVLELISELSKYQRRQYYRLDCTLDIIYRKLEEGEKEAFTPNERMKETLQEEKCYEKGIALDISGGGMRFISEESLKKDENLFIILEIQYEHKKRRYGLNANVVDSQRLDTGEGKYQHRVEYTNMNGKVRESLIKYIFEEERRMIREEVELQEKE